MFNPEKIFEILSNICIMYIYISWYFFASLIESLSCNRVEQWRCSYYSFTFVLICSPKFWRGKRLGFCVTDDYVIFKGVSGEFESTTTKINKKYL